MAETTNNKKVFEKKHSTVLLSPLATEKCIRQIEAGNVLSFVVGKSANKKSVKEAVEEQFKVKVLRVNIQNAIDGQKRAYVRLAPSHLAADISADLGFI